MLQKNIIKFSTAVDSIFVKHKRMKAERKSIKMDNKEELDERDC